MTRTIAMIVLTLSLLPVARAAGQEAGPSLERRAAEWILLLRAEKFDSAAALVSPVAQSSMGKEQLAMIWPQIRERFGDLEKTAPINRIEQGGYIVVQLLGTFSKGSQTIRVAFDKNGLVAGFFVLAPPTGPPAPH